MEKGKSFCIGVIHQKGGVGKTTLSCNTAVALAAQGYKVKVVDLDMQKSLLYFNSLRESNGLPGLNVSGVASVAELKNIIDENNRTGGVLIIDVGGYDSELSRISAVVADLIITPVSDSAIELVGLVSFRNILREIRKHKKDLVASVLLNRVHVATSKSLTDIFEFVAENQEFNMMSTIIRDRADFKKAYEAGKSVIEYNAKSNAASELTALIKEIIEI